MYLIVVNFTRPPRVPHSLSFISCVLFTDVRMDIAFSMAGQWCYSTHGWHVNWWWGVCETWQRGGRRVHIYLRYRSLCKRIFTGKCAASVGRTSCNMAAVGEGRPKACQWLDEIAWEEPRPACQFRYNRLLHTIRSGIMSNSKWFNPNSMQLMWRNILNW